MHFYLIEIVGIEKKGEQEAKGKDLASSRLALQFIMLVVVEASLFSEFVAHFLSVFRRVCWKSFASLVSFLSYN